MDAYPPLQICAAFLAATGDWRHAALLFGAYEQQRQAEGRMINRAGRLFIGPLME